MSLIFFAFPKQNYKIHHNLIINKYLERPNKNSCMLFTLIHSGARVSYYENIKEYEAFEASNLQISENDLNDYQQQFQILMRVFVCICLISLAFGQIVVTNDTATIDSMKTVCLKSPVSNLGLCNNTCSLCGSNSYTCNSCQAEFTLSNGICTINTEIYNYTVYRYLNALNDKLMGLDAKNFKDTETDQQLDIASVVLICQSNSYEYFMLGLFSASSSIVLSYQYQNSIDQVQIKFNLISVVDDLAINVDLNDNTVYSNSFSIFSNLTGTYAPTGSNVANYLSLPALTSTTVGSVITPIDTGVKSLITNALIIKFYVDSTSTQDYIWGFNDVVVVVRACESCVSNSVLNLMISVGTAAWIVALVTAILVIILFLFIKLQNIKRKLDFQNKLGSSSNNLPIKAINRVCDSLQKSVRTMEKEFKKQDKKYEKLMKKAMIQSKLN